MKLTPIKIFMLKLLLFSGIALSIIKANGWIVVPASCVVFCWVISTIGWFIYSYAVGITQEAIKEAERREQLEKQSRNL